MKKIISVLVLFAVVTAGAFAIDLSVGAGALFDLSANNGVKGDVMGFDYVAKITNTSFGGFVFLDATYAALDVSFAYGSTSGSVEVAGVKVSTSDMDFGLTQLGIGLTGKYPIDLGNFVIFPLLGINYNVVLSAKNDDGDKADDPGDMSQFGILAGVGADFDINESLYFRATAAFQLRFANKLMKDMADEMEADTTLGMGPRITLALGYRF